MTPPWTRFARRMERLAQDAARGVRGPVVPEGGGDLWRLFVALCAARPGTGYGPQPLALAEIETGARLYGLPLQPHHVAVVQAMDRAFLSALAVKADPPGRVSTIKLTVDAFDNTVAKGD